MSRDDNFHTVINEAYKGDDFAVKCETLVHGFMNFIIDLTGATEGELTSEIHEDHVVVVDKDFVSTRHYQAKVVVKGLNGEEWVLRVGVSPDLQE